MMVLEKGACTERGNPRRGIETSGRQNLIRTTLCVSDGLLLSLGSENPNKEIAGSLGEECKSRFFKEWEASYRETVSAAANVDSSTLAFAKEQVRLRWEETTLAIDCPELSWAARQTVFSTRGCFAICTGKASSKAWVRVTLPVDRPGLSPRVPTAQVKDLCAYFRDIAGRSLEWLHDKMSEIAPSHLENPKIEVKRIIRATVLGIKDPDLAAPFESLWEREVTAAIALSDTAFDEKLTSYCQNVSDISDMLSSYASSPEKGHTWFKIPLWVALEEGDMVPRVVLFFMRDLKEFTEIVGFAYDDSESGDVALRAAAKLRKIIGPWI